MKKYFLGIAAVGFAMLMSQGASAACGSVTIAEMNWASAGLMANVDKIILEKGYGCDATLVPGDTMPTFTSMNEKGAPDVAPEVWTNSFSGPLKAAIGEGRIHSANPSPITGLGEGWWIPPKTAADHPELKTVLDVINHPELFPYKKIHLKVLL
jgi:glycine betaine/proline transport system substrate-binding protein